MLPTYKESYTSYSTPSQNTQIHIYRRKRIKSAHAKEVAERKALGFLLILLGVISFVIIPEDSSGGLMIILMGLGGMLSD